MFDEVDEGTALYKVVSDRADLPVEARDSLLYLNYDAASLPTNLKNLPSDWYLRLTGEATRMLRREIPLSATIPIQP
jgi:hypothetical protein